MPDLLFDDWRRTGSSLKLGATGCLFEAIQSLQKFLGSATRWHDGAEQLSAILLEAIPGFAPVEWLAWRIDVAIRASEPPSVLCDCLSYLPERLQRLRNWQAQRVSELTDEHPVAVYSAGSAVYEALARRTPSAPPVYLAEGRPGDEGVELARRLSERGLPVKLHTDTGILQQIDEDVVVLLGTDRIGRTTFTHKVGTRAVVEAAHAAGANVLALGDPLKLNPPEPWAKPQHRRFRIRLDGEPELYLEGTLLEEVPLREGVVTILLNDQAFDPADDAQWESAAKQAMQLLGWRASNKVIPAKAGIQ